MNTTDNLALWRSVEKTDPAHTKPITGKAYSGNSPKPHWVVLKATEAFGPCGLGWGFEIVEEKLLDGALLEPGFYERIHMARVRVWYEWNGKRGTVEHVGQTIFSGKRANGRPFTDEDAPKKSVTDGLIKALSMIGFAGDIFLGRYDDSKYVSDLRRELAEAAAPEAPAPKPEPEVQQANDSKRRWEQLRPSEQAGIRASEPAFWRYLRERGAKNINNAEAAADAVRTYCGVDSRREITPGSKAHEWWKKLSADYEEWLKHPSLVNNEEP